MLKFTKEHVLVELVAQNSDDVIRALADCLCQAGYVSEDYGNATIERERHHATGLPTRPFPHADQEGVNQSALAVATLKHPVGFNNMADPEEDLAVELVIMLANNSPEEQIQTLRSLAELFGEPEKLAELRQISTAEEIVIWLAQELVLDV